MKILVLLIIIILVISLFYILLSYKYNGYENKIEMSKRSRCLVLAMFWLLISIILQVINTIL